MSGSEKYGKKWDKECKWKIWEEEKNGIGKYWMKVKEEKELKWKID